MNSKKTVIIIFGISIIAATGFGIFSIARRPSGVSSRAIRVGQDVCGEFPKEWVASVINKPIIQTKAFAMKGTYKCNYFLDDNNFVALGFDELNFETQKKGQRELGKIITTNDKIPMNHFVALSGNNVIYDIIIEITPDLFFSVDRYPEKIINETEMVDFATKVAERIKNGENQSIEKTQLPTSTAEPTEKPVSSSASLPQEKDSINKFITLIDEGKASDAVMMMSSKNIGNNDTKRAYGVQFAAMNVIKVKQIEESSRSDWTDTQHQYMVTLDVTMDPSSANAPIPYYGFERGENIRFITIIKEEGTWKISDIATGP